ncbi:hypothetical protein AUEXF2481DRAFT_32311 [Aureobasidium subglaciale EXF-2481]|uniref:MYND-type domain-containing protein n=1 Tax=Aureobasidium subglaciale (strain EXF-2481) TaxID=1043005 RepID=A0A074Y8R7_AURSE|nr:uncharacterized protein AUEXF2481DRAFT_32311 [Aureobasidium subglaciale EXF-2481]KAI5202172.1 hypothetical protein E4T38_05658 [Aureobasidium subglaciale]KAI5221126.1 hypothetical protein E4T40_05704 [Aureobasidium subglaciale]KAI5224368.1 hypothetical protein E4T41_05637 [Aureobasidium subglaciale]KAI5260988.1 hypothetical protein E4T46_05412 [Aureobasidium subglaciale]KEQ92404.1 hypothetical protein AUEXF2481DRAFT_32311 [Aureobasidium subglaciale EXF-2481]
MGTKFIPLEHTRIPGFPDAPLHLDRAPLQIIDDENFSEKTDTSNLATATGIATVLFRWCPEALYAFLDTDAWFSFTWTLTITGSQKIEIGRVENQITIGSLDESGDKWKLMLTFSIASEGADRGRWIPDTKESMLGDTDLTDALQIEKLGKSFVRDLCLKQRWFTGKNMKHELFVEYAPMDIWGDGIAMNPHWLYAPLDLSCCSTCDDDSKPLQRCGRCGTAAYCSGLHQKLDWPIHKAICNLGLEERGQMLKITADGGLIGWDLTKTVGDYEGEMSKNPNFVTPQKKREFYAE